MESAKNHGPFPVWLPWEDFTENPVTIEELRTRAPHYHFTLALSWIGTQAGPVHFSNAVSGLLTASGLVCDPAKAADLDRDLNAIGLWYLIPQGQRVVGADIDATRRQLKDLQRLAKDIGPALLHVLALMPGAVSHHLEKIPEWAEGGHQFDLDMVRDFIRVLPELNLRLNAEVEVRAKGRRPNFVLDHALGLAVTAFETAGLHIAARGPSATRPLARLVGEGSRLFIDYFRLLDSQLTEPMLAQAMIRCRKAARVSRGKLPRSNTN